MKVIETPLPGVLIIEPRVFVDSRGSFLESYNRQHFAEYGIPGEKLRFVQDNSTRSYKGVLRGLHFQINHPQGKLFSVSHGNVFDVVADVNPDSLTFGQWVGVNLSGENHHQMWVPPGYAHGFYVLSDVADVQYKCTDFYDPKDEGGLIWNDPDLGIDWPTHHPLLSDKDAALPGLADVSRHVLPR